MSTQSTSDPHKRRPIWEVSEEEQLRRVEAHYPVLGTLHGQTERVQLVGAAQSKCAFVLLNNPTPAAKALQKILYDN